MDTKLIYIDNLNNVNYKEHLKTFRDNLNKVIRITSINLTQASSMIGISKITLRRFLIHEKDEITFVTANKFNNFIFKIYQESGNKKSEIIDPALS